MVSAEDTRAVSGLVTDHVGIMVARSPIPYTVGVDLGRSICKPVRDISKCVAFPINHNPREILDMVLGVKANIVQIAGYKEYLLKERYVEIY
jgi:phosphoribosylanthranilate isomerase